MAGIETSGHWGRRQLQVVTATLAVVTVLHEQLLASGETTLVVLLVTLLEQLQSRDHVLEVTLVTFLQAQVSFWRTWMGS